MHTSSCIWHQAYEASKQFIAERSYGDFGVGTLYLPPKVRHLEKQFSKPGAGMLPLLA